MATYNKFNCFSQNLLNGVHNFLADTIKVMLTNTAPVATNAVKSDITEIAAGGGYTAGGFTVTVSSIAQTAGLAKLVASLPSPTLTATAAVANFRYAVLYDATASAGAGALISWWDYGSVISMVTSNTFTITLDPTNGVFQIG